MPAVTPYDNHDLDNEQRKIHAQCFRKVLAVAHTFTSLKAWFAEGKVIPDDLAVLCAPMGAPATNELLRQLQDHYTTVEQLLANNELVETYGSVLLWYELTGELGTPLTDDNPYEWKLHDLLRLIERGESIVRIVLAQLQVAVSNP